jgi:hypothetical protein
VSEITNADHAAVLENIPEEEDCFHDYECEAIDHAAAILSAPGVVDLDPEHTAEILTWALEFCRLDRLAMENYGPYFLKYDQMRADHYDSCPPHVREALRANINPPQRRKQ